MHIVHSIWCTPVHNASQFQFMICHTWKPHYHSIHCSVFTVTYCIIVIFIGIILTAVKILISCVTQLHDVAKISTLRFRWRYICWNTCQRIQDSSSRYDIRQTPLVTMPVTKVHCFIWNWVWTKTKIGPCTLKMHSNKLNTTIKLKVTRGHKPVWRLGIHLPIQIQNQI